MSSRKSTGLRPFANAEGSGPAEPPSPSDPVERSSDPALAGSARQPHENADLNIAYVASSHIGGKAANTVHVLNMASAFASNGASTVLIARGDANERQRIFRDFALEENFELNLFPATVPTLIDRLRFIRHVRSVLSARKFDFVYGRSAYALLAGVPVDVPVACDLHTWPASPLRRQLESLLFRRPNFAFATTITKALADRYAAAYPRLRDRLVVAPCAAKVPDVKSRGRTPRRPGPFRVYYVGHLYAGRGIEFILSLAELEPQLEFHLVGGEDQDVDRWSRQAPGNVTFHGYVAPRELAAHYELADLCIAPHSAKVAVSGGQTDISPWMSPMKIFEYMAHAKPIVAADLPVIREIIDPERDGILCPIGDLSQWRSTLGRLVADPALRRQLGSAAFDKFRLRHTWDRRAQVVLREARQRSHSAEWSRQP